VVSPDEMIDCGNGSIEIAGIRINDHAVFTRLPFRGVIAHSSDVGVIRVAQRVGAEGFDAYVRRFGFGSPTDVGLPGEASGILRPTSRWSALSLASLSFGQEIGVTALQMTAAVGAVANGGYLMRPRIVRRIEDPDGRVVQDFKPLAVRRVLEPETVDTLTAILREVVTSGTGRQAAIAGYSVAGKTGTAQKVDASGAYSMIDHVASFVGFAPVSRPAVVVLVSLDTPRGPKNEGGDVAAPVFARVTETALRALAVPPDDASRVIRMVPWTPERLTRIARRAPEPLPAPSAAPGRMPDLLGRSAREAAIAAARRGLIVELSGSGRVVEQSPAPGVEIASGGACRLILSPDPPPPEPEPPGRRSAEAS
jgi:cell division protein FtsI (penicillin-binding protein 3)